LISAPTLVIHGVEHPIFPVDAARLLAAQIPDASLVLVDGGRHGLTFEGEDQTA
jgi:pimeloyl-ACP methyl ester carboxylesterase